MSLGIRRVDGRANGSRVGYARLAQGDHEALAGGAARLVPKDANKNFVSSGKVTKGRIQTHLMRCPTPKVWGG